MPRLVLLLDVGHSPTVQSFFNTGHQAVFPYSSCGLTREVYKVFTAALSRVTYNVLIRPNSLLAIFTFSSQCILNVNLVSTYTPSVKSWPVVELIYVGRISKRPFVPL